MWNSILNKAWIDLCQNQFQECVHCTSFVLT
jgi:hypothetical protein